MITELAVKPKIIFPQEKRLRLLIDLDGVVVEYDFPKLVKEHFHIDISKQQIYAYDLPDVLGASQAEIDDMFRDQVWGKPNFIHGALETLREWEDKHEIIIFSNRIKYMGYEGLATWLTGFLIPFDEIDGGKGIYDFHIDDRPSKLMNTDSKTKLLFTQPWNVGCLNITKQLRRVANWDEIKREVT